MKTSPAEAGAAGAVLIAFVDETGALGRWLRVEPGGAVLRGDAESGWPSAPARTMLAVPGEQVTVHWLELAEALAPAQAAAAARLMLADASAEPLASLHVAVGTPEAGLTPAALVPNARMTDWLGAADAAGLDPAAIVPTTLLLPVPETGYVRRERGVLSDYRGPAAAFTLEPDLAGLVTGDAPVATIGPGEFEAGLASVLAVPALDLRQGPFVRRRRWKLEQGRARRVAMFALALVVLTMAVQVATILAYTFSADRLQAEADALSAGTPAGADRPGFGAAASVLFEAVRATPNVELGRIEYRPDGSLGATVMMDAPATLDAFRQRVEASGLRIEPGEIRSAGGRPTADVTVTAA